VVGRDGWGADDDDLDERRRHGWRGRHGWGRQPAATLEA
jgi:hypothetical protein